MNYLKNSVLWIVKKAWSVKFYILFLLMAFSIYKMFTANYELQSPIISKRAESFVAVSNERALINQELETCKAQKQAAIEASNPDLFN